MLLPPGAQRPLTLANLKLACHIAVRFAQPLYISLWNLQPARTATMFLFSAARGVLPALRGYSHLRLADEVQILITSGNWNKSRIASNVSIELLRMAAEFAIDSLSSKNEVLVNQSARFFIESRQMAQRTRLDVPSLSDPAVRDLLQESEVFVRSFSGMMGLLSPLDLARVVGLLLEVLSLACILLSLTKTPTHVCLLLYSLAWSLLPLLNLSVRSGSSADSSVMYYKPHEERMAQEQERMRQMAYNDAYRPEIVLFGLGPWIHSTWAHARQTTLQMDEPSIIEGHGLLSSFFDQLCPSQFCGAAQNLPYLFLMRNSSTSWGSLALYHNSIQALLSTLTTLRHTVRLIFQAVFYMGAFCAAMEIQPRLEPAENHKLPFQSTFKGMRIEARGLTYTYPGSTEPAIRDVNFVLEPGETLAIVGFNGSGKSTLASILMRILDFDGGELLINGVDIRRYSPPDYHGRIAAVLQSFSRFNAPVWENVGLGRVDELHSMPTIQRAVHLVGGKRLVDGLPDGLHTVLDASATLSPAPVIDDRPMQRSQGLSGGQWQTVALSRAFMRATRPEVELLVFDEPTSSLDPRAQAHVLETIDRTSRSDSGGKVKTVIFITHRLEAACRIADKIAMMENGTITEFGTQSALLEKDGTFAALYRASTCI
ncbi:P-loop containing nucleoside triphosphate hydrolase protein [Punctularia strigosozonata HHB-11173 SS5]|uniref:P-loop containing nucleoside triphosphate hydrolase protein n=1 Tax=Punctularia strigosozonata (strain HHB-11173) TaxID=741275 RepID=UPI00044162AB|nr:P-loop containing nucleoside triphosphate hydrolase protein [Punctularia strigosozonata HHB-11173 SS5]EIN10292.1 P-loop containing nucleoside triphosphate hydrolase protein [Punctularia strigosozonata HHB-11173 SS5]